MIGLFIRGAMDLTWTIEYAVQARRALIISFIWLLPLTGLIATEYDIDCRVFGVITIFATLVFVASGLAVAISGLWCARIACCVVATGQPAILARTKAGHECRECCHRFWLFLSKVPGKPLVTDIVFKGRQGFGIRTVDDLVLFG